MARKPPARDGKPGADLIVYPTAIALRWVQRQALHRTGFFDGRGHITLSSLLRDCARAAATAGLLKDGQGHPLRPMSDLDRELAIVETVVQFRRKPPAGATVLPRLSAPALEQTLADLTDTIAPLAARSAEFLNLLSGDRADPKNWELAALHSAYSRVCASLFVADDAAINASILALLQGPAEPWPEALRSAARIIFTSVRWVAPFQEQLIQALAARLGTEQVLVQHILDEHEQDWWGGPLMTGAGQLLFGTDPDTPDDGREFQSPATREAIEHLTRLREGLAMQDPALAAQARDRVGFSCSVGVYGEVEDLARRIAWHLHDSPDPLRPEEIALVTRSLGTYSDALINVFERFGIPCYFRRGIPLLSAPVIKTVLTLARLSDTRERDRFCSLLQSPWLDWPRVSPGLDPRALADDILRAGIEPVLPAPELFRERLLTYYVEKGIFESRQAAEAAATAAVELLKRCLGDPAATGVEKTVADLLARCDGLGIPAQLELALESPSSIGVLNRKAWDSVMETLGTLRSHGLLQDAAASSLGWSDMVNLLSRILQNMTVSPAPPDESGVWILNPYDMAGLRFKLVIVAGLNAGSFPQLPSPSPLFSDSELEGIRTTLTRKRPLPGSILAASRIRNIQENLLFLTTLADATGKLVFSYASHSEAGEELPPSVFFSTLWRLAGWPAWPALPPTPPDPYDQWRLSRGPTHLNQHWQRHLAGTGSGQIPPHRRRPFPGESFMGTVPLPLCRANDERLQRIALHPEEGRAPGEPIARAAGNDSLALNGPDSGLASHLAHGIDMEHQRQVFFQSQNREAPAPGTPPPPHTGPGTEYAGVLSPGAWQGLKPVAPQGRWDFSPSALARLVACPYSYYLEKVLRIEPVEPNELEARDQDIGTAIHFILSTGMNWLQGTAPGIPLPGLPALARRFGRLRTPLWAVPDRAGRWHLDTTTSRAPAPDALPLVAVPKGADDEIPPFFEALCDLILDRAAAGDIAWRLGAPEQVTIQRRRIRRSVRNLVRAAFDPDTLPEGWLPDTGKTYRRFPALFEYAFETPSHPKPQGQPPHAPSVVLADPADPHRTICVHGKVDRVDLIFDEEGLLAGVLVVDYKGGSKADRTPALLAEEMAVAADCQLPIYGLAVRDRFLHTPVAMQYLPYTLPAKKLAGKCRKSWLTLDGHPLDEDTLADLCGENTSLLDAFLRRIFDSLDRFERGDFAITPTDCQYCPFVGTCRHSAGLSPEEGGEGPP